MHLTQTERAILSGQTGSDAERIALRIVAASGDMLGAKRLVSVTSAHIDGCLYHGASGTLFCERLVEAGGRVAVPSTTNVGALNLLDPAQSRLQGEARQMALRLMVAHERLGCRPSWTCAPYQAGAKPAFGAHVAWGESNAVAFVNSVLGARTNRYGDFLDIACAISGRAPFYGLHLDENRKAEIVLDITALPEAWKSSEVFYPVLGALTGRLAGAQVCAVTGLPATVEEDWLKAFYAGAAATGAVGLAHLVGLTPEAPDLATVLGGEAPAHRLSVTETMMRKTIDDLSKATEGEVDSVALGSPHLSPGECRTILKLAGDEAFRVPLYLCVGRHTVDALQACGTFEALQRLGARFVVDTCVVVTPILPEGAGTMMTNSAKFAHYAEGNTGHLPIFGSLAECIASAQAGRVVRKGDPFA